MQVQQKASHIWSKIDDTTAVMRVPGGMVIQSEAVMLDPRTGGNAISIACVFVPIESDYQAAFWIKVMEETYRERKNDPAHTQN